MYPYQTEWGSKADSTRAVNTREMHSSKLGLVREDAIDSSELHIS